MPSSRFAKKGGKSPQRISAQSAAAFRSNRSSQPRPSLRPAAESQTANPPWAPKHLQVEVPEEYEERLGLAFDDGNPLLRLKLVGTTAGFPFLTQLFLEHQVKSRMIKVWLEYDEAGAQYGQILIEISGDNAHTPRVEEFFRQHGIEVENLGCV